jgi:hypothetical protein
MHSPKWVQRTLRQTKLFGMVVTTLSSVKPQFSMPPSGHLTCVGRIDRAYNRRARTATTRCKMRITLGREQLSQFHKVARTNSICENAL